MKTSLLRVVLSPRHLLLDASVTISVDGRAIRECGLTEGTDTGPLEVEAGTHQLSALLVGIARRKTTTHIEVDAGHETVVEVTYSRWSGKLSFRTIGSHALEGSATS